MNHDYDPNTDYGSLLEDLDIGFSRTDTGFKLSNAPKVNKEVRNGLVARTHQDEERCDFQVHCNGEEVTTQYVSVFFPGIGNITITFEKRCPVVSIDFDIKDVGVIDARGNDREIS